MDLLIAFMIVFTLYFGATSVNKLMQKIDEHEDIFKSND